jgi:hypothetical protein
MVLGDGWAGKKWIFETLRRQAMSREVRAKEAFERVKPLAEALPAEVVAKPHVKSSDAKVLSIRLINAVDRHGLRKRMEKLDSIGEFKLAVLAVLGDLQWALTYAQTVGKDGGDVGEEVIALSKDGKALRGDMVMVLRYCVTDSVTQATLDDIERGRGYADLCDDLIRLAALYVQHREVLAKDTLRYNAAHAEQAQDLAEAIVSGLASTQDKAQRDLYQRLWTLLAQSYGEVHKTALWLLRDEPGKHDDFPSLTAPRSAKAAGNTSAAEVPPHSPTPTTP